MGCIVYFVDTVLFVLMYCRQSNAQLKQLQCIIFTFCFLLIVCLGSVPGRGTGPSPTGPLQTTGHSQFDL